MTERQSFGARQGSARWIAGALVAAAAMAGCLGSAPEYIAIEGPDATQGAPDGGPDVTIDTTSPVGTDGGADGEGDLVGDDGSGGDDGPGGDGRVVPPQCLDGGPCNPAECKIGATACSSSAVSACAFTESVTNGTSCDGGFDASAVCNGGACAQCDVGANCTEAGSCQQMNVACTSGMPVCTLNGNVADGKNCGVNLFCNGGKCESCTADAGCQPQVPGNPCDIGSVSCVQGQVQCSDTHVAAPNGSACGTNQVCHSGSCVPCTAGVVCNPGECRTGLTSCATGTSQCIDTGAGQNGVGCTANNGCFQTFTCQNGSCAGSNPVSCTASDGCHVAGTCTSTGAATHTCSNPSASNTTACNDNNGCTQTDKCDGNGNCVGSNPVSCTASDGCHVAGACTSTGAATHTCSNPPAPNTTTCNDNNGCTQTDKCDGNGNCAGSNTVSCAAVDACHLPGTCSSSGASTHTCPPGAPRTQNSCGTNLECAGGACYPLCASGLPAPVGYYPFDLDFADYSANAWPSSAGTDVMLAPGGVIGNAAILQGAAGAYIALGIGPTAPTTGARTLCLWVAPLPPQPGVTGGSPIMEATFSGHYEHLGIAASPPTGSCGAANTLFMYDLDTNSCQASQLAVTLSSWNFVCYAYDGASTATFYVNGTSATVTGATQSQPWNENYLGEATNSDANLATFFFGEMDEAVVYGSALSVGQMNTLYNGGNGCKVR